MTVHQRPAFGDFSHAAETYARRPPFSRSLLHWLVERVRRTSPEPRFADIGAGTGAIAYALADIGLSGYAIEPDAEMVAVGQRSSGEYSGVTWVNAPGEETTLDDGAVDWICYSSSFHWTDTQKAMAESVRILKSRGSFTITFHLMDLDTDPFHIEIENRIRDMAPALRRARPPILGQMHTYETLLRDHPSFGNCIALATTEPVRMTKEQYVNYWAGSHDIPSQIGADRWRDILQMIDQTFTSRAPTALKFRSTAWHAQRC